VKTVRQYCSSLKTWLSTTRAAYRGGEGHSQPVDIDLDSINSPLRDAQADAVLADPWRTQPAVRRKPTSN